jgi:hypothetical protein
VQGAGSVSVTGAGSAASPYIITGGGSLNVLDTATVNLTKSGSGSVADPYVVSADATLNLDALTDVQSTAATTGQVLAKQSDGQWRPVAASSASPGAINVSGGVEGDGSAGSPLSVKLPASSGLVEDSTGLRVEGAGAWSSFVPVLSTEGAGADPTLGNGTIAGRWTRIGALVFFQIFVSAGTTTKRGAGYLGVSVPVPGLETPIPYQPCEFFMSAPGHGSYMGQGLIKGGIIFRSFIQPNNEASVITRNTTPATFAAGSQYLWSGSYEAA